MQILVTRAIPHQITKYKYHPLVVFIFFCRPEYAFRELGSLYEMAKATIKTLEEFIESTKK